MDPQPTILVTVNPAEKENRAYSGIQTRPAVGIPEKAWFSFFTELITVRGLLVVALYIRYLVYHVTVYLHV